MESTRKPICTERTCKATAVKAVVTEGAFGMTRQLCPYHFESQFQGRASHAKVFDLDSETGLRIGKATATTT